VGNILCVGVDSESSIWVGGELAISLLGLLVRFGDVVAGRRHFAFRRYELERSGSLLGELQGLLSTSEAGLKVGSEIAGPDGIDSGFWVANAQGALSKDALDDTAGHDGLSYAEDSDGRDKGGSE